MSITIQPGILIRVNELALKSDRKQRFFVDSFISSLKDAFSRNGFLDFNIIQFGHSIFVEHDTPESLVHVLKKVPGVELFAITSSFKFESLEDILSTAFPLVKDLLSDKTFRVTARRFGKHDFSSMSLAIKLGEKLMDFSAGVDLHTPDVVVFTEVRNHTCFVHTSWNDGLGGMPAGSSGKALVLFSGGIDCPVAMYQMLRKGCFIDSVFINMVGESARNEVFSVYNHIIDSFSYSYTPKMFEVDARDLPSLLKEVPNTLRQQALKIVYYLLAKVLLKKSGSWALVTGESLSQKSTQTIQSLNMIQELTSPVLVLRPLITYDKKEIVEIAREIGTFSASEKVKEQCNISTGKVTAVPHPKDFEKIPDLSSIVDKLLEKTIVYNGLIPLEMVSPEVSSLPDNSFVVDIRNSSRVLKKPIDSDLAIVYPDVLNEDSFFIDKNKTYVFVCQFGVLGKEVAHVFKKKGFNTIGFSVKEFSFLKKNT